MEVVAGAPLVKSPPLARLAEVCAVNAVPLGGIFLADWSTATALVVYWFETLLATVFTAARIAIHRKLTRTEGHHFGASPTHPRPGTSDRQSPRSFLSEFLIASLLLTALLGVFLGLLLGTVLSGSTDLGSVRSGFLWMSLAQLLGFVWDIGRIGRQPFAWVQRMAEEVMGRITLMHLAMLAGMFAMVWLGTPPAFFATFAVMKLVADLVAVTSTRDATGEELRGAPALIVRALTRLDPEGRLAADFLDHLARARERDRPGTRADDEPR